MQLQESLSLEIDVNASKYTVVHDRYHYLQWPAYANRTREHLAELIAMRTN